MIINTKRYKLTKKNYIPQGTKKNKIVIGVTYSNNMSHYTGWSNRNNGAYTRTAMFTVSMDGKVYEHFSPNYFSDFMLKPDLNESSITILLENEGWLIKDLTNAIINRYVK